MPNPVAQLHERLSAAIGGRDPVLRRSTQAKFGDYQANFAMAMAKEEGRAPRDVASDVVASVDLSDLCSTVEVAGPGFVNMTLRGDVLATAVSELLADERAGVPLVPEGGRERVVVDYSSPNLAKELHLGHLRSTIIGDALVRVLAFLGHDVIRQNHFGEWGTQFGMLIEHLVETGADVGDATLADLNAFYREANERFEKDAEFAERARARVVLLQSGDEQSLALWRKFVAESTTHARAVYGRLGVLLTPEDDMPESAYNAVLEEVVRAAEQSGVAVVDQGALVVFSEKYDAPLLLRKRDGGYLYGTTDLAAVRHRVRDLGATWLVYVVGAAQTQQLEQVFDAASRLGWLAPPARAVHVGFGPVLDSQRRMYKTRSGENVKLNELLDEAVERAAAKVRDANPDLPPHEQEVLARMVGIGAVKYADLGTDLVKGYVFDWDRMLAFEGNTGPYLQYAHARIRSIFRRAEFGPGEASGSGSARAAAGSASLTVSVVAEEQERALALQLLGFGEVVPAVSATLQPHRLCTYLFELASAFTAFYEACPVLRAPSEEVRASRLALCEATSRVLALGLDLLGIEAPDRM